ncbi:Techylectin-5A, partial [Araneus ventricosus]
FLCQNLIFAVLVLSVASLESEGEVKSTCYKKEKSLMLWDMAFYCVSKAREIYFNAPKPPSSGLSANGKKEKSRPYLEKAKQLILELEENYLPDEPALEYTAATSPDPISCEQKPFDCSCVLTDGQTESGVYMIYPAGRPLEVYCDMDTDGGGWTVIQRRGNFSTQEDFFRGWDDYEDGFGNVTQEFWLGNENIYLITNQSQHEIRFDLIDAGGERRFAVYKTFWLDDERKNYTLHIGGYSGNAGDSMAYHNGHMFSTKDTEKPMCAKDRKSGWWFDYCTESNLNGLCRPGVNDKNGMTWYSWRHHTSLAGSEMKIRNKKN